VIKPNVVENQQDLVIEKAQLTLESLGIIFENLMVNLDIFPDAGEPHRQDEQQEQGAAADHLQEGVPDLPPAGGLL